jgi:hypothetical protein
VGINVHVSEVEVTGSLRLSSVSGFFSTLQMLTSTSPQNAPNKQRKMRAFTIDDALVASSIVATLITSAHFDQALLKHGTTLSLLKDIDMLPVTALQCRYST